MIFSRLALALALVTITRVLPAQQPQKGEIHGRLGVGAGTATQPVTTGSVAVRRTGDTAVVGGALPAADGSFHIEGLRFGTYTVFVRALGYAPATRTGIVVSAAKPIADVGTITLSTVATQLGKQVVTADRPDVVLAPDRNIYSTKNMTTASGGTAIDVLRNVPSVEVDGSNNVSLRGNTSVVVQINGRPSPLHGDQLANFLSQLPASTIKTVEVSTNPNAKNDPEGTAGIINIVMNQDVDTGVSGGLYAGAGSTGQKNISGNIGRQKGPLTLYVSYGVYSGRQNMGGHTELTNLVIPTPTYVLSTIDGHVAPLSQNGMFRSEYRFTPHDAVSFDAMAFGGNFNSVSTSSFSDLDVSRAIIGLYDQSTGSDQKYSNQDYALGYHRTGGATAKTLDLLARYTTSSNSGNTALAGNLYDGDASTGALLIPTERDSSGGSQPATTFQADYTNPFGTGTKLETGLKEQIRRNNDNFAAAYLDTTSGVYLNAPDRATAMSYQEQIGAAYAVLSQKFGKVLTQGGLRVEQADSRLRLPNAPADEQRYDSRYASAFPSGIISYNFTPLRQIKLSYSRRISRPNPFQLDPVENKQTANYIFRGNPNLRPEYTDAFELGLQDSHGWGTVQLTPYLRHTTNAVRYIQSIDTSGVLLATYDNLASATTTGTDLNVNYHHGAFMLFGGGSAYHYSSDAANLAGNLSTTAFVWSARLNGTWNMSKVTDFQLFANYRAPSKTEGGSQGSTVFTNLAIRRKLWDNHGSLTLRIQDPFNMMHFGSVASNPAVVQSMTRTYGFRSVFLTFSRNFGQQIKLRPQTQDQTQSGPPQPGAGVP